MGKTEWSKASEDFAYIADGGVSQRTLRSRK